MMRKAQTLRLRLEALCQKKSPWFERNAWVALRRLSRPDGMMMMQEAIHRPLAHREEEEEVVADSGVVADGRIEVDLRMSRNSLLTRRAI